MGDFLKKIGKGLITIALSPIGIIIFAIASVTAIVTFLWLLLKATVLFFAGKSIFDPNKKDRLAEAILSGEYVEEETVHYPPIQAEKKIIKKTEPLLDLSAERIEDESFLTNEKPAKVKEEKTWSLEDIPVDKEGEKL